MTDLFDLLSIFFVVSFAVSIACLFSWLKLHVSGKYVSSDSAYKMYRRWMEFFCIALSVAIACIATLLIATDWQFILSTFSLIDGTYYTILFLLSFSITLFFKILIPVIIPLYVIYYGFFMFLFINSYSTLPQEYVVTVSSGDIVCVQGVTLSYKNLLPLPRYWVSDVVFLEDDSQIGKKSTMLFSKTISELNDGSVLQRIVILASSMIMQGPELQKQFIVYGDDLNVSEKDVTLSFYKQNSVMTLETY